MTSRSVLAVNKATALSRIEALLPESFLESLPKGQTDREVQMLDYVAGMMERRTAAKKAEKQQVEAGVQEESKRTTKNDIEVEDSGRKAQPNDRTIVGTPTDVAEAKAATGSRKGEADAADAPASTVDAGATTATSTRSSSSPAPTTTTRNTTAR